MTIDRPRADMAIGSDFVTQPGATGQAEYRHLLVEFSDHTGTVKAKALKDICGDILQSPVRPKQRPRAPDSRLLSPDSGTRDLQLASRGASTPPSGGELQQLKATNMATERAQAPAFADMTVQEKHCYKRRRLFHRTKVYFQVRSSASRGQWALGSECLTACARMGEQ